MSATISANLDDGTAMKVRGIAQREQRSVSNVVANAVAVFTDLPKDLRDVLLELRTVNDSVPLQELTREMSALAARVRFDLATRRLVAEGKFAAELTNAGDLTLLESATAMTKSELRRVR